MLSVGAQVQSFTAQHLTGPNVSLCQILASICIRVFQCDISSPDIWLAESKKGGSITLFNYWVTLCSGGCYKLMTAKTRLEVLLTCLTHSFTHASAIRVCEGVCLGVHMSIYLCKYICLALPCGYIMWL